MKDIPKILYVDDERANLDVFKNAFFKDFKIFTAESGEKGLEILASEEIDLIIADQRMPNMTGVEFLREVLEKKPGPNRILITAYADFDAITEAINKGQIFQYIKKPWKKSDIKPILNEAVELYFLKKENQRLTNELKKELDAKMQALLKAEESDRLKTAFLQNISHEIRTPLNSIQGFSELLALKGADFNDEYISNIRFNVSELIRLIDNIIELSEIQAGSKEINFALVSFSNIIEKLNEILHEKRDNHKKEHIKIDIKSAELDESFLFVSDEKLIIAMVTKLLDNAVKYTEEGSIKLRFEKEEDESLLIEIIDSGLGMSTDQLENIFNAFFKIEDNKKFYKGTGVGLTIVKLLSNILRSEVKVSSELGKGTIFSIKLPNLK